MESFYDSDEEVAWGKPSVRELKKELTRKSKKIPRRYTDLGSYSSSKSASEREMCEQGSEDKSNNSGASAYFTPDDTFQPEVASNKNEEFLEKLAKVIEAGPLKEVNVFDVERSEEVNVVEIEPPKEVNVSEVQPSEEVNVVEVEPPEEVNVVSASNAIALHATQQARNTKVKDDFYEERLTSYSPTVTYRTSVDDSILKIIRKEETKTRNLDEVHQSLVNNSLTSPTIVNVTEIIDLTGDDSIMEIKDDFTKNVEDDLPKNLKQKKRSTTPEYGIRYTKCLRFAKKKPAKVAKNNLESESSSSSTATSISYTTSPSTPTSISYTTSPSTPTSISYTSSSSSSSADSNFDHEEYGTQQLENAIKHGWFSKNKAISSKKAVENKDVFNQEEPVSSNQLKIPLENEASISNSEYEGYNRFEDLPRDYIGEKQNPEIEKGQLNRSEQRMEINERMRFIGDIKNKLDISGVSCSSTNKQSPYLPLSKGEGRSSHTSTSADTDLQNRSSSMVFNDTMEEMEMALKQGLDYIMPDDVADSSGIATNRNPEPFEFSKTATKKKVQKTPMKKFDYIQSPIGDYIRKKSPKSRDFKLPLKPQKVTSNRLSPAVQTKLLKSIVSPVGMYIKNSTGVCLKQNMPVKTVPKLFSAQTPEVTRREKENVDCSLPQAAYQPAKKTVTSTKKEVNLPSNIRKLINEPVIKKHEKRVGQNLDQTSVRKKLEQDTTATIEDGNLLNETSDVSFITKKQAFIE